MKMLWGMAGLMIVVTGVGAFWFSAGADAETPAQGEPCKITQTHRVEVGPPGSGKPQSVHERWHINEDCTVIRIERVEMKASVPERESADEGFGILACTSVQSEFVMDDVLGQDLTRSDVAANWCYDGSAVTWWASPPAHNAWAFGDGWVVDGEYYGDTWVNYNWQARVYNDAYFHWSPCFPSCYSHHLFPKIDFRNDGSATCLYSYGGTFPGSSDFDTECYYF